MKYPLTFALAGLLCAGSSAAQDRVELYADKDMKTCAISEPVSPPVVQVHVFVTGPVPASAVRFRAPKPDCWVGATWLGDALEPGIGGLGSSQTDWSVAFYMGAGGCTASNTPPVYLGAISYLITGQAQPCCEVPVLPALQFVFVDCEFAEHPLEGKSIIVNPDESCGCHSGVILAVETSTWGRVKSLYR